MSEPQVKEQSAECYESFGRFAFHYRCNVIDYEILIEAFKIAENLTPAQERAVKIGIRPDGKGKWPLISALIEKKLFASGPYGGEWHITGIGKLVRNIVNGEITKTSVA